MSKLQKLKEEVLKANQSLVSLGLVTLTWGNVSGIDREKGLVVIKPSGVDYSELRAADMVVVDLNGNKVEGAYSPSSDTATHLHIYKNFDKIGGVVHTHSKYATIFSQAGKVIQVYGTTHADYFDGYVPVTRDMKEIEVKNDYELNTGKVIVETFSDIDPYLVPAVLVKNHAPFCWGENAAKAIENALVLEEVAHMAIHTEMLCSNNLSTAMQAMPEYLQKKHFYRKHGTSAYYGQQKSS